MIEFFNYFIVFAIAFAVTYSIRCWIEDVKELKNLRDKDQE